MVDEKYYLQRYNGQYWLRVVPQLRSLHPKADSTMWLPKKRSRTPLLNRITRIARVKGRTFCIQCPSSLRPRKYPTIVSLDPMSATE